MDYTADQTLARATTLLPRFNELLGDLKYEDRGVFFSELLFLWAAVGATVPRQVVESGRARGLSTAALLKLFPQSRIVSLEYEADHPDARYAEQALSGFPNLALLYGDAKALMPELLLPGDIALIDGPKGIAAVGLALRVLATGKPAAVFIHDCFRGQAGRTVLDAKVPGVFYSDAPDFVARFRQLDDAIWSSKRQSRQDEKYGGGTDQSYGPTLACIPYLAGVDYARLADTVGGSSVLHTLKRSWRRLRGSLGRR
jgi:predicted O-methyltransferase YrrM